MSGNSPSSNSMKKSGSRNKLNQMNNGFKRSNSNNRNSPNSMMRGNNANLLYQQPMTMNGLPNAQKLNMNWKVPINSLGMMLYPHPAQAISPVNSFNDLAAAAVAVAAAATAPNVQQRYKLPNSQTSVPEVAGPDARTELAPHINESESRALILFHSPQIPKNTVRQACQKFGVLYYIRPEFHRKGVTLLSYFDLRVAVKAQATLSHELGDKEASAHFSVMLHAINSNTEESRLIIKNLPDTTNAKEEVESKVDDICARYGQLRSIQRVYDTEPTVFQDADGIVEKGTSTVSVEYFNIQDARLAASEISASSTQLWTEGVTVEFAPLEQSKQQLCRQLLASLSRWRTELARVNNANNLQAATNMMHVSNMNNMAIAGINMNPMTMPGMIFPGMQGLNAVDPTNGLGYNMYNQQMQQMRYMNYEQMSDNSYANGNNLQQSTNGQQNYFGNQQGQQQQSNGGYDKNNNSNNNTNSSNNNNNSSNNKNNMNGNQRQNFAMRQGHNMNVMQNQHSSNGYSNKPAHHYQTNTAPQQRRHRPAEEGSDYNLNVDRINNKQDVRTTVMVRNIPNKYTQQMLLHEVNMNHEGTYDFFYLPIDFKNRCNVGYAFINFVKPECIVRFVEEFQGHRWKNFNSGKICEVTYARIQGQSAMVARFQNSSLLEKDDEYRPLLFYSGKREPFPEPRGQRSNSVTEYGQQDNTSMNESKGNPSSEVNT
jgi:hypothetical protein